MTGMINSTRTRRHAAVRRLPAVWRRHLPLPLVLLAVLLTYSNSFRNDFHFDDYHAVNDNPAIRSLHNLPRIFTDATAFSVLPTNQTYRPLVTASLALDYALGHGYNPFWFHAGTFLCFLALIALLNGLFHVILDRTDPDPANRWLALAAAAWFGLHPAMAETVNYIIQRGDLYCTLGCVAALFLYARWPRLRPTGLYLVPFALAMLSKPPAAVFPLLLWLYIVYFEKPSGTANRPWRSSLVATLPALAVCAALLALQSAMTPKTFSPGPISAADYRLTQPYVWLRYAASLVLPIHLNVDTDLDAFTRFNARAALGFAFLALLIGLIAYASRRRRLYPIAFGLAWFVVTQLPTSLYPLSEVENDHRMFFSFPGLMLAGVWALSLAWRRLPVPLAAGSRPAALALAACCLCAYAFAAHRRNAVWHTEATLWADDIAKCPRNGRGLMMYGLIRMKAGDLHGALNLFERALPRTPAYPALEVNLGIVNSLLAAQGDAQRSGIAENHFRRALALDPSDDTGHALFGRWLLQQGRLDEAADQLQTAIRLNPQRLSDRDLLMQAFLQQGHPEAARQVALDTLKTVPDEAEALAVLHGTGAAGVSAGAAFTNASLAAYRAGNYLEAIDQARQALAIDPSSAAAWNNVGAGYGGLHQWDAAIEAERHALQLDPGLVVAQNNLRAFQRQKDGPDQAPQSTADWIDRSLALYQEARYQESLTAARQALAIDPNSAEAWNNVAADQQAMQHWDEAIAAATRALELRPDFQLARNNLAYSTQQRTLARPH